MAQPTYKSIRTNIFLWVSAAFAIALGFIIHYLTQWHLYIVAILSLSLVNFSFYGFDKARSKGSGTRIPEKLLHLISLLGGFPGGWLGRTVFRHKTSKIVFIAVLTISTLLHAFLLYHYLI